MAKNQDENYQKKEKQKSLVLFILMFLLFLLILIVGYFLFIYDFSRVDVNNNKTSQQNKLPSNSNNTNNNNNENNNLNNNTIEIIADNNPGTLYGEEDLTEIDLKKLAASFAERFGSYSNQSKYDNFKDLKLFMSDSMKSWTDEFIEEKMNEDYSGEYYGISTKAVVVTVDNFDPSNGVASATVETQRIEGREGEEDNVIYQDLKINFVKDNKNWVVDEANWQ